MLLGLGTDLCRQARIEKLLERFGDRFLARVFSEQEAKDALAITNYSRRISRLTSAFSLKEAMSKALGTGITRLGVGGGRRDCEMAQREKEGEGEKEGEKEGETNLLLPVFWRDIESARRRSGKPFLRLSNNAKVIANRLAARRGDGNTPGVIPGVTPGVIPCVEVSLSDEEGLTHAIVALYACNPDELPEGATRV